METGAVSDAMDQLGLPNGTLTGLHGLANTAGEITGTVRTATVVDSTAPGIPGLIELLDGLGEGDVLVLGWRTDTIASTFGDLAAKRARSCGCVAMVSDGWVRDLPALRDTGLAVWARGAIPLSGKGRLAIADVGLPVELGDVSVHEGDAAIIDETGVCIVPAAQRGDITTAAEELERLDAVFRGVLDDNGTFASGVRRTGVL
jgi:4-hydroxy-4-methyl-2-oxoglutarate aldolase